MKERHILENKNTKSKLSFPQGHQCRQKLFTLEFHDGFIYLYVVNICLFTVFRISASIGYCMWLYISGYHSDRCGLYTVPKTNDGHIGYQTATYQASLRSGR